MYLLEKIRANDNKVLMTKKTMNNMDDTDMNVVDL